MLLTIENLGIAFGVVEWRGKALSPATRDFLRGMFEIGLKCIVLELCGIDMVSS